MSDNDTSTHTPLPSLTEAFTTIVQPAPPFYRAAVLRMVRDYEHALPGDAHELAALNSFVQQQEQPYLLLAAPTGRGKTSLLLHWLHHVCTTGERDCLFIPITMRYQLAAPRMTLRALAQSLAAFHNDHEYRHIYNRSPDQLRPVIASYLQSDAPPGRRLLLVIDGLDETVGWRIGRDIVPRIPGANLHIVASVRANDATPPHTWLDQLGWQPEQCRILTLDPPGEQAIDDLLHGLCAPLPRRDTAVDVPAQIRRVSENDPHTMRMLAHALHAGTLTPEQLADLSPGLESYTRHWLRQHEHAGEQTRAIMTLSGLCATAMSTLSSDDVQQLAPDVFPTRETLRHTARMLDGFLAGDGSDTNGYVFDHLRIREIFREHIFSQRERRSFQQRFVQYGDEWFRGARPELTSYIRRYWIEHLEEAGAWERIEQVLTSFVGRDRRMVQPWVQARFNVEGNYVGYLSDLDIFWRWAEQHNNLVAGFRSALIASTLRSMSGNLLPELLERLVTVGVPDGCWSMALALRQVRQMTAPGQKVRALQTLVSAHPHAMPVELVMDVIHSFADERWRAEALATAAPVLPPDLLPTLLALARDMHDSEARSRCLTALVGLVPPDEQPALFAELFEAMRLLPQCRTRGRMLAALIPTLPDALLPDVAAVVDAMRNEKWKTEAMLALVMHPAAPHDRNLSENALAIARQLIHKEQFAEALPLLAFHLPAEQQPDVYADILAAVRTMAHAGARSLALLALLPYLSEATRPDIISESLSAADSIGSQRQRVRIIPTILSHLPTEQQRAYYRDALSRACQIDDERERADTLRVLAHHMPVEPHTTTTSHHDRVVLDALDTARAISDEWGRGRALIALVPHLPPAMHTDVCREALDAVGNVSDEWQRSEALIALAPHTPPAQFEHLLAITRTIADEWQRAETLTAVAPCLPPPQQQHIYAESLAACRAITDRWLALMLLAALVPHLPPPQRPLFLDTIFDTAHALPNPQQQLDVLVACAPAMPHGAPGETDERYATMLAMIEEHAGQKWSIEALLALVPHLPPAPQTPRLHEQALAIAHALENPWHRVQVLCDLAPHLPPDLHTHTCTTLLELVGKMADEGVRAEVLVRLAALLPAVLHAAALREVCSMQHERHRTRSLAALVPYLPAALQADALAHLQSQPVGNETWLAETLITIVPHLSDTLLPDLLTLARSLQDSDNRARVLSQSVPFFPAEQQYEIAADVLATARTIGYIKWRADVLVTLAPHVPDALQADAIAMARDISDAEERGRVLRALVPLRPTTLLPEALDAARSIASEEQRVQALAALADELPPALLRESLDTIHALHDTNLRVRSLVAFAPHAPAEQQTAIYAEALATARAIPDGQHCATDLCMLAPHLPTEQQALAYAEALAAACSIDDDDERSTMLDTLGQQVAEWSRATPANRVAAQSLWHASMRFLASPGRPAFLRSITALVPWLVVLAPPDELLDAAHALVDVVQCWH